MASYTLTTRMLEYVEAIASDPLELKTGYRNWMPITTIPATDKLYWYYLNKVQEPALSMDGKAWNGVRTARVEGSNPIIFMRYGFEWDYLEIQAAARNNVPLQADDARMAKQQCDNKIAQFILTGLDVPDVISGLTETGTDLGAAGAVVLDGILWNTADQALIHAGVIKNHFRTNGVTGPFSWVLGTKCGYALGIPLANGGGPQQQYITPDFDIFYEREVAAASFSTEEDNEDIYPLVYTADDSAWVALSRDPQYHSLVELEGFPRVRYASAMDESDMVWRGWYEWAGTMRTVHAAAACYMEDVDFS
jgi:hypothetical protein